MYSASLGAPQGRGRGPHGTGPLPGFLAGCCRGQAAGLRAQGESRAKKARPSETRQLRAREGPRPLGCLLEDWVDRGRGRTCGAWGAGETQGGGASADARPQEEQGVGVGG